MSGDPSTASDDTRCALCAAPLDVGDLYGWAVRPDCGAVVVFSGTSRDHSGDRTGVEMLEYEAYESEVVPRFEEIARRARERWPELGRIAIVHRTGEVPIGDASVVVVVSSPHRAEAFEAGRYCIDLLKDTAPIWKRETWAGGESWGLDARNIAEVVEADANHDRSAAR